MNSPLKKPCVSLLLAVALVLVTALPALAAGGERTIAVKFDDGTWLGVLMQDLSRKMARELDLDDNDGVLIEEVLADSPAKEAGIEEGDVIVEFDGRSIDDSGDLSRAVRKSEPGDEVEIVFLRDGETHTVTAELSRRDQSVEKHFWRDGKAESFHFDIDGNEDIASFYIGDFGDRGFMGVTLQDLSPQLGEYFGVEDGEGALIETVSDDSPAAEAGLQAGDVIIDLAGDDIESPGDVTSVLQDTEAGDEVDITVLRDGDRRTLTVTLGEAPEGNFSFFGDGDAIHLKHLPRLEKLHGRVGRMPHNIRVFRDHDEDFEFDVDGDLDDLREEIESLRQEMKKLKKELREIDE